MASIIHQQIMQRSSSPLVDELCPICFLPSLLIVSFFKVSMDGVTHIADRIACTACKEWHGKPMKVTTT